MPPSSTHSDIFLKGYIGRLPNPWRAYALLMRLDRPAGTWLLFQPCAFAVFLAPMALPIWKRLAWLMLFLVGSWAMRSAGCILNDLWDRKFDALVERTKTRPLASGEVSPAQAMRLLAVLLFIAFLLLICLPVFCWKLGILALAMTAFYPTAKRFIACPQLVLGLTFGFGTLIAYAAIMQSVSFAAIFLYLGVVFWQIGYDTIYGFQDMEDDRKIGVKSASLLMHRHARLFVGACYGGTCLFFTIAALLAHMSLLGLAALLPGMILLLRQVVTLNPELPALCLRQFQENVIIGWVFMAGWALERFFS